MESTSPENYLYIGIAIVLVVFTVVMFIQGWMMKLAVRICGGDEIGVFYGASALTLSSLGGVATSAAVIIAMPQVSPWIPILASLVGTIGVLCLMLRMGPIRAFGVYITQCILSFFAVGATAVAIAAGAYFLVPADTMQQFAENAKSQMADVTPASFQAGPSKNGTQPEIQNLDELARILNFDVSDLGGNEQEHAKAPPNSTVVVNPLQTITGSNTKNTTVDAKNGSIPRSPFDNKIRSNPFVK